YEMLTGELPLGRFAPPSQKVQVDVRLDEVVLRALEKEPERRHQHASDVKAEVETITHTSPHGCPPFLERSKVIKALLLIVLACCLFLFLSFSASSSAKGHRIQVGFPSPWFEAEGTPTGFNHHVNLLSWSWAIAALGALSCYLYGAIRRRETEK